MLGGQMMSADSLADDQRAALRATASRALVDVRRSDIAPNITLGTFLSSSRQRAPQRERTRPSGPIYMEVL